MKSDIKVYVPDELEDLKKSIDLMANLSDEDEADVIFSEFPIKSDKPLCIKSEGGFDVLYGTAKTHIPSADPLLAMGVGLSLQMGFKEMFVSKIRMRSMISRMLQSFIVNSEVEDAHGLSHSERVTKLVEKFAPTLGIVGDELDLLREYSMLHDVGKIGLEQLMLYTPTRMRMWLHDGTDHTVVGSIFLATTLVLDDAAPIARSHHEKWNGQGYPDGLKGEEIPYYARLIGICDFYDEALNTVSSEILGRPLGKNEVVELIEKEAGESFDPVLAKKFVDFIRKENTLE
ncbi:HD-GYP domain-containing protein [Mesoaciditoga lauensis]|uniref:HD-GYP domain-containing protein n=1 Tax=Mesoaciditoga lauensis TaxID=1495039 RepID=UPI00068E7EE4|nr:HD domain-containing phosphohydrolase [Mesoaciditoga lauensis]